MLSININSINGFIFKKASQRLNLKRREKIILQRLLGFLLRNDRPFPYSRKAMSEMTGYSKSSIDESLNRLEHLRLIERIGFTSRIRFKRGSILCKYITLAQKRTINKQINNYTLAQKLGKNLNTSPVSGYKKTSSSLKHLSENFPLDKNYQEYVGKTKSNINLGLAPKDTEIMDYKDWLKVIE